MVNLNNVVVNMLNCDIAINEFELQLLWTNIRGKVWTPLPRHRYDLNTVVVISNWLVDMLLPYL